MSSASKRCRPDMASAVVWALKANYLSTSKSCALTTPQRLVQCAICALRQQKVCLNHSSTPCSMCCQYPPPAKGMPYPLLHVLLNVLSLSSASKRCLHQGSTCYILVLLKLLSVSSASKMCALTTPPRLAQCAVCVLRQQKVCLNHSSMPCSMCCLCPPPAKYVL